MKYILIKFTIYYDGMEFDSKEIICTKCKSIQFAALYYIYHYYEDGEKFLSRVLFSNCAEISIKEIKELTENQYKTLKEIL